MVDSSIPWSKARPRLVGCKVTGDPNVPANQWSFVAQVGWLWLMTSWKVAVATACGCVYGKQFPDFSVFRVQQGGVPCHTQHRLSFACAAQRHHL